MGTPLTESSVRSASPFALSVLTVCVFGCSDDHSQGHQTNQGQQPLTLEIRIPGVAPGVEGTECIKARLPNADTLAIGRIVNEISSSSHHFVVSTIDEDKAGDEQLTPTPCEPFRAPLTGAPLAITQKHLDTYETPPGVGYPFVSHQMIHLELHYINNTHDPVDVVARTRLYPLATGELEQEASVMLVGDLNVAIPADSEATLGPKYQALPSDFDGVHFFAMTGHTHRFGTNVSVGTSPNVSGAVTPKYALEHFQWDNPEVVTFAPPFEVPTGGGFTYSCSWKNPTNEEVVFGESANQEMCFFWAYYYPRRAKRALFLTAVDKQ